MVRRLREAVEIHERQTDIEGSYFLSVVTVALLNCQESVPCPKGSSMFVSSRGVPRTACTSCFSRG